MSTQTFAASRIALRRQQLDKYMTLRGMKTQRQLAEAIGVNETTVYRALEGRSGPGEKFIAGLLAAFSPLTFDDLFEVVADAA